MAKWATGDPAAARAVAAGIETSMHGSHLHALPSIPTWLVPSQNWACLMEVLAAHSLGMLPILRRTPLCSTWLTIAVGSMPAKRADVWAHCMELQQAFSGVNVRLLCGRMDLLYQRAVVESSMALYGTSDALICMLRAVSVRVRPPPWSHYIHMVPNVLSIHSRFHK